MSQIEYITLGYITQAHGIRGEIFVKCLIDDEAIIDLVFDEGLIVRKKSGEIKKFVIDEMRPHKEGFIMQLEDFSDRNEAEKLKGSEWILEAKHFVSQPGENLFLREILGFEVFDKDKNLGRVTKLSSNGQQDILIVESAEGQVSEVLLVKPFIKNLDFENKKIFLELPEGYFE